jgi:hypothetical protein
MGKETGYVAPPRKQIKDEVCKLLPHVDQKLIRKLDWWALYTIHQDVVKDGKDAEALARKLVKGYDPEKIKAEQEKVAARKAREEERKRRAKEVEAKKALAKKKAAEAKQKARAAKEAARARARASREKARAKPVSQKTAQKPAPAASTANAYVPPVRKHIKDELAKLMPMIKRSDLTGLDYWALYTMHSDIVKSGRNPEELAKKFIKGYKPSKK